MRVQQEGRPFSAVPGNVRSFTSPDVSDSWFLSAPPAPSAPPLQTQAVYVPADDLTDPAPATTFAHLDATTVLSRSIAELGIYPAVDPLDSTSRMLDPRILGERYLGGVVLLFLAPGGGGERDIAGEPIESTSRILCAM